MRCLYCGIKLKIAAKAKIIKHCPECILRIESEGALETFLRTSLGKMAARKKEKEPLVRSAAAHTLSQH